MNNKKKFMEAINMIFTELFGSVEKIAVLEFLADHPNYSYTMEEIQDQWICLSTQKLIFRAVDDLVEGNLVKIIDTKYQLNTSHPVITAILKFEFEEAKKVADKLTKDGK